MPEEAKECPVCDIASVFAVTKGICNTFREKGLDCTEFLKTLDDPEGMASDAVKAFLKLREDCKLPEVKEMLDYIAKASQLDTLEFEPAGSKEPTELQPAS
jgi:5,10-methenyltetrahydromethanopterin hydrogenase